MSSVAEERPSVKTPAEWLRAMDNAAANLNYDGVFSYYVASYSQLTVEKQRGDASVSFTAGMSRDIKVATFRIVHMVIDGVERERIAHLGGPRREILRTGQQVSYILPQGDESFVEESALPTGPFGRLFVRGQELGVNYGFRLSGRSQVIGRPTVCLEVHPLDSDRYGYLLWLDEDTGLLLRSELRDAEGNHLETVQFTELTVGDSVLASALEPDMAGLVVRPGVVQQARQELKSVPANWEIGWVPAGFQMTDALSRDDADARVHVMYSDGLATFSLFIEPASRRASGVVSRNGATVLLSHDLTGRHGDFRVTVVGEVPPGTAQRIAESVHRD